MDAGGGSGTSTAHCRVSSDEPRENKEAIPNKELNLKKEEGGKKLNALTDAVYSANTTKCADQGCTYCQGTI